ncbi:hypothetical protein D3C77_369880 [compost metagenome]
MQGAAQVGRQINHKASGIGLAQAGVAAGCQCFERLSWGELALSAGRSAASQLIGIIDDLQTALGAELVQGIGEWLGLDIEIQALFLGVGSSVLLGLHRQWQGRQQRGCKDCTGQWQTGKNEIAWVLHVSSPREYKW